MTSHDVVASLRRILGIKKIGHAGTLDPEVTGVLPICIGKATRISEFLMESPKKYQGQLTLGKSTTTQDFTGETTERVDVYGVTKEEIERVFESFIGEIEQVPPMYSSVKIHGKKLYELARQGKEVVRKPRKVTIYDLKLIGCDLEHNNPTIDFQVVCSKGTYVRTLCVDIGNKLGYPAHMSKLVRLESGSFNLEQSLSLEEVERHVKENKLDEILVPMANSLPDFQEVVLSDEEILNKVFNGQVIRVESLKFDEGIFKVVNRDGKLVALYEKAKDSLIAKPIKVFK
ncbi:tRNA pseudouridine(55) synthase TruB [Vulcanibacillus modesticaldus]|uniref:tRNA pseudouridine synthase B n=2 Tax=Vulcanibacillus modesticaldus TaxID=337097 RepID=A0A1D2YXN6_9BACI|nr:tRNA pseudouridine(55) synthase TruB [Vulcanibacillus modesticaldus]